MGLTGGRRCVWIGLGCWICLSWMTALAEEAPRIVSVQPVMAGEWLTCRLMTAGLPGEKLTLSMRSGLVSSLELFLDLVDGKKKVLAENRLSFRLAFDLWEEMFSLRGDDRRQRFNDLEGLTVYLSDLRDLPLVTLTELAAQDSFQVRVEMLLFPIAPSERDRVESVIGGDNQGDGVQDGQEISINIGQLIKFFYKDRPEQSTLHSEMLSGWFHLEDLQGGAE